MVTHNALLFLFPGYRDGDWVLQNDGEGSYIAQWNRTEPQPTQEQIEAVTQADLDAGAFQALKAIEISSHIETREKMCARVAGIGQRLGRAGDTAGALSCDAVVNGLLDVLKHSSVTEATDIVSLKAALKARYSAAVSVATASALTEFKRYDK